LKLNRRIASFLAALLFFLPVSIANRMEAEVSVLIMILAGVIGITFGPLYVNLVFNLYEPTKAIKEKLHPWDMNLIRRTTSLVATIVFIAGPVLVRILGGDAGDMILVMSTSIGVSFLPIVLNDYFRN